MTTPDPRCSIGLVAHNINAAYTVQWTWQHAAMLSHDTRMKHLICLLAKAVIYYFFFYDDDDEKRGSNYFCQSIKIDVNLLFHVTFFEIIIK